MAAGVRIDIEDDKIVESAVEDEILLVIARVPERAEDTGGPTGLLTTRFSYIPIPPRGP